MYQHNIIEKNLHQNKLNWSLDVNLSTSSCDIDKKMSLEELDISWLD